MVVLPGLHVLWCVHTQRALLVFTTRSCGVGLGWVRLSLLVRLSHLPTGLLVDLQLLWASLSKDPHERESERSESSQGWLR